MIRRAVFHLVSPAPPVSPTTDCLRPPHHTPATARKQSGFAQRTLEGERVDKRTEEKAGVAFKRHIKPGPLSMR